MFQFDNAVHGIYEAALHPELWPGALSKVAALSHSAGAAFYIKTDGEWVVPACSTGIAEFGKSYVAEGWRYRNPWLQGRAPFGFHAGDAYSDPDIITPEEMRTNAFYASLLPRFGLAHVMVALFHSDLGQPSSIAAYRGAEAGPFAKHEILTLLLISRHIEQALRIGSAHAKAKAERFTLAQAFDVMDEATMVLDEDRRAIRINHSAERFLGRHFVMSDEGVRPASPCEEDNFVEMVNRALAAGTDQENAPQPTTVSDPGGDGPLVVWASPLEGAAAANLGIVRRRNVLLMAKPVKDNHLIDPTLLRNIFGLTTGEARLASLLASGRTVRAASKQLGIAEGTARVVLKRIFDKTGVHRQVELVRKITALAK